MQWGTSMQRVVGHVTAFCPSEGHPRGHFTMFCAIERHIKRALYHVLSTCGTLGGTLPHSVHCEGTLEGISSCYIHHRCMQEGTFVAFFNLTLRHQGAIAPHALPLSTPVHLKTLCCRLKESVINHKPFIKKMFYSIMILSTYCSSEGRAGCLPIKRSMVRSSAPPVNMSNLGKILKPKLLPMAAPCV